MDKINYLANQLEPEIDIIGLKKEPYNYQKLGIEFLVKNNGRGLITDEMGCGKTLQALGYLTTSKTKKALVICNASGRYVWNKEIEESTSFKSAVLNKRSDFKKEFKNNNVLITNYDIVKDIYKQLQALQFEVLICDEFHMIKNNSAKRTKAVKAVSKTIPKIILLSGTPLLSRPVELFNGLNLVDPITWRNWYTYTQRYCNGHRDKFGHYNVSGSSNLNELRERIKNIYIRRMKKDVLTELPDKIFTDLPIELSPSKKKEYNFVFNEFAKFLKENKGKSKEEVEKSLMAEKLVKLNELRQVLSSGKIDAARELINNVIEGGGKIVVFSCYNKTLEELHELYKKESVILTGKHSESERAEAIKSFQNNKNIKVFFGGIVSAGVGITLTEANNVLFIDYDWIPANHWQASDRCHRIGQKASCVNVYQFYCRDTIDDDMREILKKKEQIFKELFEKNNVENYNIVKDLLASLDK